MANEKSIGKSKTTELYDRVMPVMPGSDMDAKVLAEFLHGKQFVSDKTAVRPVKLRVEEDGSETYTFERITTSEEDRKLYYIKAGDPSTNAFGWAPKPTAVAEGLVEIGRITTYYPYGYEGFFKPTQNEVISQIPKKLLDTGAVVAYAVHFTRIIGDMHEADTVLYGKKDNANKQA